ncbi:hypothetical protein AL035_18670 [Salipiger aestuarii]|uniref:Pectate lyase-like protein n=1 Tax=Salipiger aestuarii TaxID=568098 RepID=A0A327XP00_9RHOB|nr:hypothetical protein [Salipiger aestuarii]KAB2538948.1 hypothetical protein AL035_18670 [Salipiger aestuarii]RAK09931.1 hypothetical protein ATI53_10617 [Salipiger aestuarii]
MKRRDLLLGGALLPLGHGGAARQTPDGAQPFTPPPQNAQALRQASDLGGHLAAMGLVPGDCFALMDGSRYALLPPEAEDHDLPLPEDALTQKLRVLPSEGQILLASWGVAPLSPARNGPDPRSAPDVSEALSRAVARAMATHAELVLPPGMLRVRRPGALLARSLSGRHDGLRITGAGQQSTVLVYDPEDASEPLLWNNNAVLGLRIARMTLYTDVPGAVFARIYGSGISQDHQFIDMAFRGRWGIGVEMVPDPDTGSAGNNNSEFLFDRVHSGVYLDPFTLLLGRSSDQNLNYWFHNCKLWGWVTIARLHKGGHLHISDCDVSGYAPKAPNYLVELLGDDHARGVCACTIRSLRVELKTAQALVLRSEWPSGNIEIAGLDLSSQTYRMTPGAPVIDLALGEGRGPILSVSDSQFAGQLRVINHHPRGSDQALIAFTRCSFFHGAGPDEVVIYDGSMAPRRIPDMIFRDCRGAGRRDRGLWDCNLGALLGGACRIDSHQALQPADGSAQRLPRGARIEALLDPATLAPTPGLRLWSGARDVTPEPGRPLPVSDGTPLALRPEPGAALTGMCLLRYLA